jgi:hypothetical protein
VFAESPLFGKFPFRVCPEPVLEKIITFNAKWDKKIVSLPWLDQLLDPCEETAEGLFTGQAGRFSQRDLRADGRFQTDRVAECQCVTKSLAAASIISACASADSGTQMSPVDWAAVALSREELAGASRV